MYKELGATNFISVQDIPVVTRTRLLNQNFVVTLSKSVAMESKKKLREQVATKNLKNLKAKTLEEPRLSSYFCNERNRK